MAATQFVFVSGKAKWLRHNAPDPWGNYKHTIYLNPQSVETVNQLIAGKGDIKGIKNLLKKDEDGYYMVFRRPASKLIKGKVVGFAPPELLNADGSPLRDVMVGNGSDITTKLEVYNHNTPGGGKAMAARWLSTRVDNLIPFEGHKDFDETEQRAVKGLQEQPKQLF